MNEATDHETVPVALKPCPFCASEDVRINESRPFAEWYVKCHGSNDCGASVISSPYGSQEEAVERWNRRDGIDGIIIRLEWLLESESAKEMFYGIRDLVRDLKKP